MSSCCGVTCCIAILFLVANVFTMLSVDCKKTKSNLYKLLNSKQNLYTKKL